MALVTGRLGAGGGGCEVDPGSDPWACYTTTMRRWPTESHGVGTLFKMLPT